MRGDWNVSIRRADHAFLFDRSTYHLQRGSARTTDQGDFAQNVCECTAAICAFMCGYAERAGHTGKIRRGEVTANEDSNCAKRPSAGSRRGFTRSAEQCSAKRDLGDGLRASW